MNGTVEDATESAGQLVGMWRALVEDRGARVGVESGLHRLWADISFAFYNALTFSDAEMDLETLRAGLAQAAAFMRGREASGFLWVFEELLTEAARRAVDELAEEAGLVRAMTCHGMAGDVLPLPEPGHSALRFERVATEAQLDAYAALNARAYDMSEADAREALRGSALWRRDIHAYLGLEGDTPVCCAGACPVDGRLFVVLVATEPSRQRRGFGEAVTRKALYEGARATGLRRATLHATAAGRPVYERIGLEVTSQIPLYTLG